METHVHVHNMCMCILQEFFQSLQADTGYDPVNLSIIHTIHDILFIEVRHAQAYKVILVLCLYQ